ncbi:MAG: hypothetical protein A2176_08345 [Spirochaetes bacterium RBG_13_51_14]|nr:MAG: hypothetical protein A2176_08345 [Spirochaetes bacterium RBG_13_51_14]
MSRRTIMLILIFMALNLTTGIAYFHAAAAQKKNATAKAKPVRRADIVPRQRVMIDFTAAYTSPQDAKTMKTYYSGRIRNTTEKKGAANTPVQIHQVTAETRLKECGLPMRNTWEARYYKLETAWIFEGITPISSKPAGKPTAKLPGLADTEAGRLVSEGIGLTHDVTVQDVALLGKKGSWNLCTPQYLVSSKLTVVMKNEIYNTGTTYECLFSSTIIRKNGVWEFAGASCVYRGKEMRDCNIGTMCRELAAGSDIPVISDTDALDLMRDALEREYGLKKNNIAMENLTLLTRLPPENFGTKIPCTMQAMFVIDENREISGETSIPGRTYVTVRAVYECIVNGFLQYSREEKTWHGIPASCCSAGNQACGFSCSEPAKGCRRLGEK